jgi:hypothetical protein|tara:strand:+ start:274 stop:498 length:225 start_codon:yes stop_codon:yes gene_type:complete
MSLEYTKRLLELRDYATDVLTEKTSEKNKSNSLVSRPNNEEEEEENPIDEVQKNAFLEVVMSNLQLKEQLDDSV